MSFKRSLGYEKVYLHLTILSLRCHANTDGAKIFTAFRELYNACIGV